MSRLALIAALAAGMLGSAAKSVRAADYVTIRKQVEVDAPADAVWARVGGYCAIAEWMKTTCEYPSGSGGVGTVRKILNGTVLEVMVAQTPRSYTYWQIQGNMAVAAYHGTLAAEPFGRGRTRLSYTLFYDQAAFASDDVRKAQRDRLEGRFQGFLEVMKAMAEGRPRADRQRREGHEIRRAPAPGVPPSGGEPRTEVFTFAIVTVGVMNGTDLGRVDDETYR